MSLKMASTQFKKKDFITWSLSLREGQTESEKWVLKKTFGTMRRNNRWNEKVTE